MYVEIALTARQAEQLLDILGTQRFSKVVDLYVAIQSQANASLKRQAEAKRVPDAATERAAAEPTPPAGDGDA